MLFKFLLIIDFIHDKLTMARKTQIQKQQKDFKKPTSSLTKYINTRRGKSGGKEANYLSDEEQVSE